jgi:hypothetical protein
MDLCAAPGNTFPFLWKCLRKPAFECPAPEDGASFLTRQSSLCFDDGLACLTPVTML